MNTQGVHRLHQIAAPLRARLSRRAVVQAANTFAIAGLLLAPLARPAAAQGTDTPLSLHFVRLHCVDETGDGGREGIRSDEPYVVMFAADISGTVPQVLTVRTDVFSGVDDGNDRSQRVRLWGRLGAAAPIPNPDNVIFLVGIMEHDGGSADSVRAVVNAGLFGNLTAYRASGLDRATIVSNLRRDMDGLMRLGGRARHSDNLIGPTRELRMDTWSLWWARRGGLLTPFLDFVGADSHYQTFFELSR